MRVSGRFITFSLRDIPYSINYTGHDVKTKDFPFKDIKIEKEGESSYITASYDGNQLRDRVGAIDAARLDSGDITLPNLAYKHFAYVLD